MTTNHLDNHEKFINLYELYYQDLLRYAISIVKSHSAAEELVHDAYVKILKRIEDIEEPASARTKRYLVITVRNTCYDYLLKFVIEKMAKKVNRRLPGLFVDFFTDYSSFFGRLWYDKREE